MESTSPGAVLRETVAQECIQIPGAPNALAARLIERYGFEAMYLSGAALSAGDLALPDMGLFTLTELVEQTRRLTGAAGIPLIVDAANGFGDVVNVERTVFELESAGAAAIQLTDQQHSRGPSHISGKTLLGVEDMCAKVRAASVARAGEGTVIIARTDARGVTDLAEAATRAKRYLDAGADWIFPEALQTEEEFAQFAQQVDAPLVANMTEFGKSPLLDAATLGQMGYAAILYPVTLLRVAMRACEAALAMLSGDGHQRELIDLMQTREELYDLLEVEEFEQRGREYFRPDHSA